MKHTILEKFLPRIALAVIFFVFTILAISLALNYSTYSKFKIINTIFSCGIYILFIYLIINRNKPRKKIQLKSLIRKRVKRYGENCNLNDIDVSKVTDMRALFFDIKFNGDISKWNVSNVKSMQTMFMKSNFNGDISNWDVSNVEDMKFMFSESQFNGDISKWNVSKVKIMGFMFHESNFEGNIENWNVIGLEDVYGMFFKSKFKESLNVADEEKDLLEPPYWYLIEEKVERSRIVANNMLHKDLLQNLKNDKKQSKKVKI